MSAAVFLPDPLLARAAPAPAAGGFGVEPMLLPAIQAFQPDPVMARATEALLQGQEQEPPVPPSEPAAGADEPPALAMAPHSQASDAPAGTVVPGQEHELHDLLDQRYREGFEDGLAEAARLMPPQEVPESSGVDEAPGAEGVLSSGAPVDGASAASSRDVVLLLEALSRALQPLLLPDDATTRFEPLKRLALHLAMELVRTELTISPKAVENLVMRSVQALQARDEAPMTVELHPQDLALLRLTLNDPDSGLPEDSPLRTRVQWKEATELARGSVRARSDVSMVEDLIQHRLVHILQDLRVNSLQWRRDEAAIEAQLENPDD